MGTLDDNKFFQEWKQCQASLAEFDKMILDIRKYGFSFITILLTANGFLLGFAEKDLRPPNWAFIGILLALLILIGGLFRVDRVHEIFLRAAVLRAMKLEEILDLGLSRSVTYWSETLKTATWGVWIYILLAVAGYSLAMAGILGGEKSNQVYFISDTVAAVLATIIAVSAVILICRHHFRTIMVVDTIVDTSDSAKKSPFNAYVNSSKTCWKSGSDPESDQEPESQNNKGEQNMGTTVYFAGPLFTHAEKMWNLVLVEAIRKQDQSIMVILPQVETKPSIMKSPPDFSEVQKICLDGIRSADVVVAILDGPDSDSGTCFECGYAFAQGKPVVGVRTDVRAGEDQGLNAMLTQSCDALVYFHEDGTSEELEELAKKIVAAIRSCQAGVTSKSD